MYDDLVKRLRTRHANEYQTADLDALDAAYRIEELEVAVLDLAQHVPTADLMFYTKPETRLVFRKLMEKQNDPTSTINPKD